MLFRVRQGARSILLAAFALLLFAPRDARADDWLGPDKARHFGVSVLISAGGYAASSLVLDEPWQRALCGGLISLGIGAGKEAFDALSGGDASHKDFAWDGAGTLVGVGIAFSVDSLWLERR